MSEAVSARSSGSSLPQAALVTGILAMLAFFVLGFTLGDWWFVVGPVVGLIAIALGVKGRSDGASSRDRRVATIGLVLGAVPVVWFVAYMVVAAIT